MLRLWNWSYHHHSNFISYLLIGKKKTGSVGCNYIVLVLRKVNLFYIGSWSSYIWCNSLWIDILKILPLDFRFSLFLTHGNLCLSPLDYRFSLFLMHTKLCQSDLIDYLIHSSYFVYNFKIQETRNLNIL